MKRKKHRPASDSGEVERTRAGKVFKFRVTRYAFFGAAFLGAGGFSSAFFGAGGESMPFFGGGGVSSYGALRMPLPFIGAEPKQPGAGAQHVGAGAQQVGAGAQHVGAGAHATGAGAQHDGAGAGAQQLGATGAQQSAGAPQQRLRRFLWNLNRPASASQTPPRTKAAARVNRASCRISGVLSNGQRVQTVNIGAVIPYHVVLGRLGNQVKRRCFFRFWQSCRPSPDEPIPPIRCPPA